MNTGVIKPTSKQDWFTWLGPPAYWCQTHAATPGLQWGGDGQQVTKVTMHRSHLPLIGAALLDVSGLRTLPGVGLSVEGEKLSFASRGEGVLRPYQQEGLKYMQARRGTLLAFEMRLGKTVTAAYVHDPADGMLVVVGPLASRDVWRGWIERVHGCPPLMLQGRKDVEPQPGYPAYFVHYDVLDAHMEFFASQRVGTLILDECHLLMNPKTRRTQAASMLSLRASRVVGLSGTPMWGEPISMHAVLHAISPGAWGTKHAFGVRYGAGEPGAHGWRYDGVSHEEELRGRLAEVIFRRTWSNVVGDLPFVTRVVEPVQAPSKVLQEIHTLALDSALAHGTSTMAGYLATLRRKFSALKVKPAAEAATRAMQDGHKVVLWYWHNDVGDKMAKLLREGVGLDVGAFPVFRLRSDDGQRVRDEEVQRFRETKGPAAIIAGIAVGGVAIDLSCSDYAIFAELDWTPANVYQAEMRTFSPLRPHVVVYLTIDHPIEQTLATALGLREDLSARVGLGSAEIARMVLGNGIGDDANIKGIGE